MSTTQADSIRFIYQGQNYLVPTSFVLKEHPGGKDILLKYKDSDITEAFKDAEHSADATEMLEEWIEKASPEQKKALKERADKRNAEFSEWRWRSTAIAFSVATVVAAYLFAPRNRA